MSAIFIWAFSFDAIKQAVDFLYRYLIVCKHITLSFKRLCLLTLTVYVWAAIHSLHYFDGLEDEPQKRWGYLFANNTSMWCRGSDQVVRFAGADAVSSIAYGKIKTTV